MTERSNCAVCGRRCPPPFRAPTAEMAPDLDGRPGEPARSTLGRWVASCPDCGAAAPDLSRISQQAADLVRQPQFDRTTSPFLRWAALAAAAGLAQEAAEAVLWAAWHEDDRGGDASSLRRRAASAWRGDTLRQIDILRRAGALDEAAALARSHEHLDEEARLIVAFQMERIAAGDTGRHSISSALRPPARSPHVTHGRKKSNGGLVSRLFGR